MVLTLVTTLGMETIYILDLMKIVVFYRRKFCYVVKDIGKGREEIFFK